MIKLNQISKIYNQGKTNVVKALDDVSLQIEAGSSVAIIGVSGSGKSTLLNIIGCLDQPTSGEYYLNDKRVDSMTASQLADIRNSAVGIILQDNALLNNESVYSNVRLPLLFTNKCKRKEHKAKIKKVLEELNIQDLSKRKITQLSGGQKQRVSIARAIINDPQIILADEPTSALDKKTAEEVMEIFINLKKIGKTIVMVTHDIEMAKKMDKIINIVDGKIGDCL